MKSYVNYRDNGQTEERVQIAQATCNNMEDIEKAIEKSKRNLKKSDVPSGYKKLDEEIVTTVYKVPGKSRSKNYSNIHNINKTNNITKKYFSKKYENNNFKTYNTEKRRYFYDQSESSPNYNERFDSLSEYKIKDNNNNIKKYQSPSIHSAQYGTIYNFNTITKNHGYLESKSPLKNPFKTPKNINTSKIQYQYNSRNKDNKYNTNKRDYNIKTDYNSYREYSANKDDNFKTEYNFKRDYNSNRGYNSNKDFYSNRDYNCNKDYYSNRDYNSNKDYYSNRDYNSNTDYKSNYYYSHEIRNKNYIENEDENLDERRIKKYTNITPISGGRIENHFENEISQDGKYVITVSISKRVMDEERPKQETRRGDMYNNNYYREEVEEINEDERIPREYQEQKTIINKRVRDYGDNYNYLERNENRSPLKITETHQRRREPIHVYGNEYYETNEEISKHKYYPIRTERKVTRYYTNENYDDDCDEDFEDEKEYRNNKYKNYKGYPSKYEKNEMTYYNY